MSAATLSEPARPTNAPDAVEILQHFQVLPDEAAWKAARREFIGASEASAVCGFNPFAGPVQVWNNKITGAEIVATRRMEMGHHNESLAAKWYAEDTGRIVVDPGPYSILRHADLPYIGATLDRLVYDKDRGWGVLEIKWANVFQAPKWRENERAPEYYIMQVNHQIDVVRSCGVPVQWGALACILGSGDFRTLEIEFDERMAAAARIEYAEFWAYVERKEMPPVDGLATTKEILEAFYQCEPKALHAVDPSDAEAVAYWTDLKARYELARETAKAANDTAEALKNEVRDAIGRAKAEVVDVPGVGSFKWATINRAGYTVEPTSFRQIGLGKPLAGRLKK